LSTYTVFGKGMALLAGAGALMLVQGVALAASDLETCTAEESSVEAVERIGACSRALDSGLDGETRTKALFNRGVSYGQLGQMDLAIADLTSALEIDKANIELWVARSRAYYHKQQYDLAMLDLAEAIKLQPDNAVAHNLMGKNHFMLGNYELAIGFFNKAIDLDANFYNAFINRATTYYRDNKLTEAMKDVNAAYLMLPPGDSRGRGLLQLKVAIEQAFAAQQRATQTTN
jgi:tetratricopeptide (TPR) repeat protein